MCSGQDCPKKDSCFRHIAEPNKFRQSYFLGSPMDNDKCNHYWEVKL
jgi:hypothetical protein